MPSSTISSIRRLMIEDLERSGLDSKDVRKLKLNPLTSAQTKQAAGRALISYKIPYFTIDGKQDSFYRIRFLENSSAFGKAKKPQRYSQPKDSSVKLYLPPFTDWMKVKEDIHTPIIITEGEKKAAKVSKEGAACIGLGGVWSFRSKKELALLVEDFDQIQWQEREVLLIFDSDLKTNDNVLKALNELARQLTKKGSLVYIGFLPEKDNGDKMGLDDFLLEHSISDLDNLDMETYEESTALWELNTEIAYINNVSAIYHIETKQLMKPQTLHEYYADREVVKETARGLSTVPITKEWMRWPQKRRHSKLTYSPGRDEVLEDNSMNIWPGWGIKPKKGNIEPWKEFVYYFFQNDMDFYLWFEKWLAYPLQNPGSKLFSCVLLHGVMQGTGKTFVGHIMSRIYGSNFKEITNEHIHGNFNEWSSNRQFVMGDEITGSDKRKESDKMKNIITRNKITINKKYSPEYEIEDTINYLFTSNHVDAFFLEPTDRRVGVYEAPDEKPEDTELFDRLDEWCWNEDGPAHLFYYLLNEIDCSDFNPNADAFENDAKRSMKSLSLSDLDSFTQELKESPEDRLVHDGVQIDRDLYTAEELVMVYDPEDKRRTSNIAMSKSLKKSGFKMYITKTSKGTKKLWAIKNIEKWKTATHNQRVKNYDQSVIFLKEAKRRAKFKQGKDKTP